MEYEEENEIIDEKVDAIVHKDASLKRLDKSFVTHIEKEEYKKSNLLAYWLNDFANYHDDERYFNPENLRYFKRGDIIKVNLGFNIGNELGGLHYCVVINKNDNKKSGNLNVIPLTSKKEGKIYDYNLCVNLENELFELLNQKSVTMYHELLNDKNTIDENLSNMTEQSEELKENLKKLNILQKLTNELMNMKQGSIALIQQITTISKQRIYKTDILNGIKLSNNTMDLIDEKIKKLFTK